MTEFEIKLINRVQSQRGILLDNYCATQRVAEFIKKYPDTPERNILLKNLKRLISDTRKELIEYKDQPETDEDMQGRLGI